MDIKSFEYREASSSDLGPLFQLCLAFHGESRWSVYSLAPKKLVGFIKSFIEDRDRIIFVSERDGVLVGCIFGELTGTFWSNDLAVYERMWYVDRKHRGTMSGVRLLKCLEEWSRARGAKEFFIGHSSGMNRERSDVLLKKLGYESVAELYGRVL